MGAGSTRPAFRPPVSLATCGALFASIAGLLGAVAWHYGARVMNHDVSWLMVAAGRLAEGGRFGSDVYELNAPGAVLIYAPAAWLWRVTGWPANSVLVGYVLAWTTLCLLLTDRALRRELGPQGLPLRAAFALFAAAVLLALPRVDFGQREHLIVILLLPYCLTQVLAAEAGASSAAQRGIAAGLAAIAIAIKPIYAPLPLLLILGRARRVGLMRAFGSIEAIVLLALGSAYLAGIVLAFPEWIGIARRAIRLYPAYARSKYFSSGTLLQLCLAIPALVCVAALNRRWTDRGGAALRRWVNALLLLCALSLFLFVVQRKGWSYHFLPVQLSLGLAVGGAVLGSVGVPGRVRAERAVIGVLTAMATAVALLSLAHDAKTPAETYRGSELVRTIRRLAEPPIVAFLSTSLEPAFPLVTELDLVWGSRFPQLWTLVGLRHLELRGEAQGPGVPGASDLGPLEQEIVGMIVADLDRYQPTVVAVDERSRKQGVEGPFDIVDRLSRHASFRAAWAPYARVATSGWYAIYQRAPSAARDPQAGVEQGGR